MASQFDEYRRQLDAKGYASMYDLEIMVLPLVRNATKLVIGSPSRPPEDVQRISHFGGDPYFEKGEKWPSLDKRPLDFVFQIVDDGSHFLPEGVGIIQFFYDFETIPLQTSDQGWQVKVYTEIDTEKQCYIERPDGLSRKNYCSVVYEKVESLPDWGGVQLHCQMASRLSCVLDEAEPSCSYNAVVEKLIGEQMYQSQLGGYPKWIQGESTPKNKNGQNMEMLLQIDSEQNAGVIWGDVGLIYVFYDPDDFGKFEFVLQCS